MAPRETENKAHAKFWGEKQRALWYVMVFLEWSITGVVRRIQTSGTGNNNFIHSNEREISVQNIPVGRNQNGLFHLIYQPSVHAIKVKTVDC